jgi:predicted lipoprotein with Yx(FWY)xxD motif
MRKSAINRPIFLALMLGLMAALLIPALAGARTSKVVAKQAPNEVVNKEVLTTMKGHTLYSLSVEKHGKFICTGSCLSIWHPLVVPKGVEPKGPVALGTVKRPDGRTQVSFKGRPLYSFGSDTKKGEANGEGIMDVGTWHAAVTGPLPTASAPEPQPQPPKPENPYGY